MFSWGQRNKQCSAARLRGFSGNRPFNRPMGHQFILLIPGKLFYLHFPAHRLFLRLESLIPHKPHRPPGLRVLRPAPGIVRLHPFFQVIRPAAVECPVRTFQKICVVHLSFSISLLSRHLPAACHGIPESGPITDYVNGNGTMESITVLRKPEPAESI